MTPLFWNNEKEVDFFVMKKSELLKCYDSEQKSTTKKLNYYNITAKSVNFYTTGTTHKKNSILFKI